MKKTVLILAATISLCLSCKISIGQVSTHAPKWKWAIIPKGEYIAVDATGIIIIENQYLTKYSTDGKMLWTKQYLFSSSINNITVSSITVSNSGYIYMLGNFNGDISLGRFLDYMKNCDNTGNTSDLFVAKFDANGNIIWAKSVGGTLDDFGYSLAVDNLGNSYVSGCFKSNNFVCGNYSLKNFDNTDNTSDLFVAKFDANGNIIWAKSAGGDQDDYGISIAIDVSANSYVTGSFNSRFIVFGSDTLKNADSLGTTSDLFLVKYNPNGKVLWAKSAGGIKYEYSSSIAVDFGGNIYLSGNFSSHILVIGFDTLKNYDTRDNNSDLFLLKFNATGHALWAKSLHNESNDGQRNPITVDSSGNIYETGSYKCQSLNFGSNTLKNNSNGKFSNVFFIKYDTNGSELWAKKLGTSLTAYHFFQYDVNASSIAVDASGNVYLAGRFYCPSLDFDSFNLVNEKQPIGINTVPEFFLSKLPAK